MVHGVQTLNNCRFESCHAVFGGAIAILDPSCVLLAINTTFFSNSADGYSSSTPPASAIRPMGTVAQ
jgi:hypothetical protein